MIPALSLTIQLLLFIAFEVYALLGIWGLSLNSRSRLNRLFFIICYSLAIWSLALVLSNAAPDLETALLWRRFAVLGWGAIYSLMAHYFLILTGYENALKKIRTYIILYVPSLANIFVYGISKASAEREFHLSHTSLGWVNTPTMSFWDTYFNIYYISFSLLIMIMLIYWGWKNKEHRLHALKFILTYLLAFALGSVTDILGNRFIATPLPAMAPIFIIFPMIIFASGVKWHGIQSPLKQKERSLPNEILSEREQGKIYKYIGFAYIAGSFLNFGHYFFYPVDMFRVMHFGSGIFFTGFTLLLLPNIRISKAIRDLILTLIMPISIFLIMNQFIEEYGSNIVWPIPLLFMSIATIFNRPQLLVTIIISAILTQLWSWTKSPTLDLTINEVDHALRLALYIIGAFLALYVRKIYLNRLKEIDSQVKFQKLISQITSDLVSVNQENLEKRINSILKRMGDYLDADHAVLLSNKKESSDPSQTYYWWSSEGSEYLFDKEAFKERADSFFNDRKLQKDLVQINGIDNLSGLESMIFFPVINKETTMGYLCFCYHSPKKTLSIEAEKMVLMAVNLISDVLAKIDIEKKINYMAFYDHLTGLPNRALFHDRVGHAIPLAKRSGKIISVMMLDLDAFKNVNDTMGHFVGDLLLQEVANKLSGSVRDYDTISRFGGDEFVFVLSQLEKVEDVEIVAKKLIALLGEPITIGENEYFVTASIGIAVYPFDGTDAEALVKNADLAMYASKKRGRNQYSFCSTNMKEKVREQMSLTNDLYKAIERKEFILHYQPQVETSTKRIIGLEALIRWQHPEKGLISPTTFIPLAEQAGVIDEIGGWVMTEACSQICELQKETDYPIRIAVNLSMNQFLSPDLVEFISSTLESTGLPPEQLELEITESIAMVDSSEVNQMLYRLKELGVTISIDDFGTQYSSLSRLKEMPVDRLKIDKQFVDNISFDIDEEAIAQFIVSLSRNLGLEVIAEGVENREQYDYLLEKGCDEIQGYYFSKPKTVEEIKEMISNGTIIHPL